MEPQSPASQLIALLQRTAWQQRRTLELLEAQRQAMVARDLTRLGELAGALVELAEETQQIEQKRAALSGQLASLSGSDDPAGPSLRDIAAALDDEAASSRLLALRDELLDLQAEVSGARERNQTLAASILEANDATLRTLMEALREAGHGPEDGPRVLDRRA